ncbi:MAG: prepilin-type N-terminal cleavage/methylation domain-containing protein [Phycisphaerae bacterium]|nr:prepilin-type N-terminal cleavage/methylation domain-containing protein [Phycisphaerae bacterium]
MNHSSVRTNTAERQAGIRIGLPFGGVRKNASFTKSLKRYAFPQSGQRGKSAFTLIELLVVIAIISLLVSILLPSLTKAKLLTQQAACMANLHNIGIVAGMYQQDYEYVPIIMSWAMDYIDNTNIFLCPVDPHEGLKPPAEGDSRMAYPFSEDWGDHSVPNSYWNWLTQLAVWGSGNTSASFDYARVFAEEMAGKGQEYCYIRCMDGHTAQNAYPTLTPSGRVVIYEPYLPNIWDCWDDWYRMPGF